MMRSKNTIQRGVKHLPQKPKLSPLLSDCLIFPDVIVLAKHNNLIPKEECRQILKKHVSIGKEFVQTVEVLKSIVGSGRKIEEVHPQLDYCGIDFWNLDVFLRNSTTYIRGASNEQVWILFRYFFLH